MTVSLEPGENIALTVARAQIERGERPSENVAYVCCLALMRLVDEDETP